MPKNNHRKPTAAGKSSFDLVDVGTVYRELDLKKGITFLDVACGRGAYSLKASEIVGSAGTVYAVDLWQEGIEQLIKYRDKYDINNGSTNLVYWYSKMWSDRLKSGKNLK